MPFIQISTDVGPYKAGNVYEVNENRMIRMIGAGNARKHDGPATPPPPEPKPAPVIMDSVPVAKAKPAPKSAATAAKASPPGRKVNK